MPQQLSRGIVTVSIQVYVQAVHMETSITGASGLQAMITPEPEGRAPGRARKRKAAQTRVINEITFG